MALSESALRALFVVSEKHGLGDAIGPKWVCNAQQCSGVHRFGHGPQSYFSDVFLLSEEFYYVTNDASYGATLCRYSRSLPQSLVVTDGRPMQPPPEQQVPKVQCMQVDP